jgi:hypothetical protein
MIPCGRLVRFTEARLLPKTLKLHSKSGAQGRDRTTDTRRIFSLRFRRPFFPRKDSNLRPSVRNLSDFRDGDEEAGAVVATQGPATKLRFSEAHKNLVLKFSGLDWFRGEDLNLCPSGYEFARPPARPLRLPRHNQEQGNFSGCLSGYAS